MSGFFYVVLSYATTSVVQQRSDDLFGHFLLGSVLELHSISFPPGAIHADA
jgi:hypothetical protein